jgi:hypothetical protein
VAYPDPKIVTVAAPTNPVNTTRPPACRSARSTTPTSPYVVILNGGKHYSRAKCGEVEQRQCMRTIVSFALAGKPLTQQLANHVNGSMGTAFIPSALPALARVFQDVLREEAHIRPTSVAVVEAAYSLTA